MSKLSIWYTKSTPEFAMNNMKYFDIKISKILMLLAGVLLISSLPFLSSGVLIPWVLAQIFYIAGLALLLFNY